ncbi:MAG: IS200/IS605 family transposase [archaeon]|nr:IS200/IS605 family transposase [archaeon]
MSLLRYLCIFCTKNLKDIFITDDIRQTVRQNIWSIFNPKNKKRKDVEVISIFVYPNYVEINFQTNPTLELSKFINNLKSVSARNILKKMPQIRAEMAGLWNNSYLLLTREQFVTNHIDTYLQKQWVKVKENKFKKEIGV